MTRENKITWAMILITATWCLLVVISYMQGNINQYWFCLILANAWAIELARRIKLI